MRFLPTLTSLASLASLATALTSTLTNLTSVSAGPTAAGFYIYVPTTKLTSAPIVVAIHWCGGSASDMFADTLYATYADTYGYIVIYPDSPSSDKCWDVASLATLSHNGGGDSLTIVNMVKYAIANYGGDASRVYSTGISSGAMMTNVLAGAYPDVFKAGAAYSGVPDGCFYVSSAVAGAAQASWNVTCSEGLYIQTAAQWGALVRSYYPGYTGSYPRMALYHGTADTALAYVNLAEELKEWSNLLGVSFSYNLTNTPEVNYTKIVYGDGTKLFGVSELNVGHPVSARAEDDLVWFGIMSASSSSTLSVTSSTVTSSSKSTSASATGTVTAAHWAQCGGIGYTGPTVCASPYTCTYSNAWYSQCL